jgi:hypothetical protein
LPEYVFDTTNQRQVRPDVWRNETPGQAKSGANFVHRNDCDWDANEEPYPHDVFYRAEKTDRAKRYAPVPSEEMETQTYQRHKLHR